MVEPIQGEGGVQIPSDDYLPKARALCDKHNVLLIVDEIQTGIGRTGKMLCQDHYGIQGDLVTLGKALSGGFYPVSAVVGKKRVMNDLVEFDEGDIFSSNPLACRVMIKAIEAIYEEKMIENSEKMGNLLTQKLRDEIGGHQIVREIRNKGLFVGIELKDEYSDLTYNIIYDLLDQQILAKQTQENIIRMAPPLTVKEEHVEMIVKGFKNVFAKIK